MKLPVILAGCICLLTSIAQADLWCTAYYPGYRQADMPPAAIDFTAITHLVQFSAFPTDDGGLILTNSLTPDYLTAAVAQAHAANKKILLCVGGAGSSFENAVNNNLSTLLLNVTNAMATNHYDGIDIDWEPLPDGDATIFTNFVTHLRTALDGFSSHKILTIAVPPSTTPSLIASVQNAFDQINIMTYDLSGPYDGWVTWYNSPIYNAGITFPSVPGEYVPSVDATINNFLAVGIPTNKMAMGIAFYGDQWQGGTGTSTGGVTQPAQSWSTPPTMTNWTYNQIISAGFTPSQYHYDTGAQSAYYSVTNANPALDEFIAFDDPRACAARVSYARNGGLGGIILFEIGQDHQPGQVDPLLNAIDQAMATPGTLMIQHSAQSSSLTFTSAPLGSYQVQWTTNLTALSWNSLLTTNLSLTATGGVIQVSDPGNSNPVRFYRVKTPP